MNSRIVVYSRQDAPLFDLDPADVFERKRVEVINGEHSLTITTTTKLEKGQRILTQDATGTWREHVVTKVDEKHASGDRPVGTYLCEWSLQHDLYGVTCEAMPGTQTDGGVLASVALAALLGNTTRWGVGTVDVATSGAASFYNLSAWEALGVLVDTWGGEVGAEITVDTTGVVTRKVALLSHTGSAEATRRFEWRRDLSSIARRESASPVFSRIKPLGKGEAKYGEDGTATGGYGRRVTIESVNDGRDYLQNDETIQYTRVPDGSGGWEYPTKIVVNDKAETPSDLLIWARSVLTDYTAPKVTYSATVAQFAEAGMDVEGVALGDVVHIVDTTFEPNGLRIEGRITKMTVDELNPASGTSLVVGEVDAGIAAAFKSLAAAATRTSTMLDVLGNSARTTAGYISHIFDSLNEQVNALGGSFYILPGRGAVTYDAEVSDPYVGAEASRAVEIRGGAVRIADSRTAQGEWDWKTIITSGHIVANLITAAQLTSGFIGSPSGNYWNLDTGELRMASTAQFGDTTVEGALSDIISAQSTANAAIDGNLIPYSGYADTEHGWRLVNATSNGAGSITINATSTLDWSHSAYTAFVPLSTIWDRDVTFSINLRATAANTTVIAYIELFRKDATSRYAWTSGGFKTFTVGTASTRQTATVRLNDSSAWAYTSSDDTAKHPDTDVFRIYIALRTANSSVTLFRWKLQYGSTATAWTPAISDASATASLNTLTQEDVFNRLTNNGTVQGIYLQNGQLYINGQYIEADTVVANKLGNSADGYYAKVGGITTTGTSSDPGIVLYNENDVPQLGFVAVKNTSTGYTSVYGQTSYLGTGTAFFGDSFLYSGRDSANIATIPAAASSSSTTVNKRYGKLGPVSKANGTNGATSDFCGVQFTGMHNGVAAEITINALTRTIYSKSGTNSASFVLPSTPAEMRARYDADKSTNALYGYGWMQNSSTVTAFFPVPAWGSTSATPNAAGTLSARIYTGSYKMYEVPSGKVTATLYNGGALLCLKFSTSDATSSSTTTIAAYTPFFAYYSGVVYNFS